MIYQVGQGNYDKTTVQTTADYDFTGKTLRFTVKRLTDKLPDDSEALIVKDELELAPAESDGKVRSFFIELTPEDTNIEIGVYKFDIRIYTEAGKFVNTTTGRFEITDIVTKENGA